VNLLRVSKEVNLNDARPLSGYIERLYAAKGDDSVYHTRYRYKVSVKFEGDNLVVTNMLNNTFHSNNGPAIFTIIDEGSEDERYFLASGEMTHEEWLERRDRLQKEPFDDMLEELLAEMGI
jgi:hypothetical protein